jgi:hypothetical protein
MCVVTSPPYLLAALLTLQDGNAVKLGGKTIDSIPSAGSAPWTLGSWSRALSGSHLIAGLLGGNLIAVEANR